MTSLAVPFGVIPMLDVEWLWPGWVPRRHVTLVTAPGGTSKGLWAIDIAARVTTGAPWPGEPADTPLRKPEAVILVAPEDDPNEAVAWRLAAAGANPALVFNLTELPGKQLFHLPDNIAELRALIEEIEATWGVTTGLIIIDPVMSVVEKPMTTNLGARRVITPLESFAHEFGGAIILTNHTTKSGSTAGSKAVTDAVRVALRIERPEKLGTLRVVTVEKANMVSDNARLSYNVYSNGQLTKVTYATVTSSSDQSGAGYSYVIAKPDQPGPPVQPQGEWQSDYNGPTTLAVLRKGHADVSEFPKRLAAMGAAEELAGKTLLWQPGARGTTYASDTENGEVVTYTLVHPAAMDLE